MPACLLNRDDNDEPKTLQMGGVPRWTVSSQCWKHALRHQLEADLGEYAARTRMLPPRIAALLRAEGWPPELAAFAAAETARAAAPGEGLKTEPDHGGRTAAMLFASQDILAGLVDLCRRHRPALEQAAAERATRAAAAPDPQNTTAGTKSKNSGRRRAKTAVDAPVLPAEEVHAHVIRRTATINLFGRMLAEVPEAHVDGAVQLAPAFTVHRSDPQPDFFTAVEDWALPGEAGSAHLQTGYRTTGVLYRYATVNLTELTAHLDGDHEQARDLLARFAEAFITSLPQAKRTATAPHTLPYLVHYAVRDRRPVSYAAAFEQPVQPARTGGYTRPALRALSEHAGALTRLLGTRHRVAHGHAHTGDDPVEHLGVHHASFEDLVTACTTAACTTTPAGLPPAPRLVPA
ncbi:type I-E CRISPR-associated protein Cas7/Cse4/CasC [Actinacidiphila oryziradicis]|uniref:Type I-E CRISPR-associated protein Cas7/Cse4/CasC n=2 Tax=Actinacidiphila oryziradicis TaxID=2571141 RepID=A0A4U0RTZ7_9ACTN|nr:type I-E CRISPR-associated protein Cas7/Cse4/CasC [Actinacidiphila oryziradicis]